MGIVYQKFPDIALRVIQGIQYGDFYVAEYALVFQFERQMQISTDLFVNIF